eukprot:s2101_g6.t5
MLVPMLLHGTMTLEAMQLHESVPPDRWCVKRADLKYFWKEVAKAIRTGRFVSHSTATAGESPRSAAAHGPSIYAVSREHIVPVTERAGKMSWALMRHPDGLPCDLFISHAWQEGVFEFLSKVLHSWPPDARHAWCCMLANPQNLDIGALLSSPSQSPFALALKASRCVLVVPNRHCSIYTRLWCGYEAFQAHEAGKPIFIARPSNRKEISTALIWTTAAGIFGLLCGAVLQDRDRHSHYYLNLWSLCIVVAVGSISANLGHKRHNNWCSIVLNRIGALACGFMLCRWQTVHVQAKDKLVGAAAWIPGIDQRMLIAIGGVFFLLLEVDRVNGEIRQQEAQQLSRGFSGTIRHATASEAADAIRILDEIGEKTDAVDYAIQVLLTAWTSSPTLREVAAAGVDIRDAGCAEIAFPSLAVLLSLDSVCRLFFDVLYIDSVFYCWIFQALSLIARIGLVVVLWRSPRDERCYILKMMTKMFSIYFIVASPLLVVWELRAPQSWMPHPAWFALPTSFYVAMLGLSCLGMHRLLNMPVFGPCLLQFFLARGFNDFCCWFWLGELAKCSNTLQAALGPTFERTWNLQTNIPAASTTRWTTLETAGDLRAAACRLDVLQTRLDDLGRLRDAVCRLRGRVLAGAREGAYYGAPPGLLEQMGRIRPRDFGVLADSSGFDLESGVDNAV